MQDAKMQTMTVTRRVNSGKPADNVTLHHLIIILSLEISVGDLRPFRLLNARM
jgi:hypothetical protein